MNSEAGWPATTAGQPLDQTFSLRRATPAKPNKPLPSSQTAAGNGVVAALVVPVRTSPGSEVRRRAQGRIGDLRQIAGAVAGDVEQSLSSTHDVARDRAVAVPAADTRGGVQIIPNAGAAADAPSTEAAPPLLC
jgi:phage tail tape-measure protein